MWVRTLDDVDHTQLRFSKSFKSTVEATASLSGALTLQVRPARLVSRHSSSCAGDGSWQLALVHVLHVPERDRRRRCCLKLEAAEGAVKHIDLLPPGQSIAGIKVGLQRSASQSLCQAAASWLPRSQRTHAAQPVSCTGSSQAAQHSTACCRACI
jgi:hypothetical protein